MLQQQIAQPTTLTLFKEESINLHNLQLAPDGRKEYGVLESLQVAKRMPCPHCGRFHGKYTDPIE